MSRHAWMTTVFALIATCCASSIAQAYTCPLGAKVVDNSGMSVQGTADMIVADLQRRFAEEGRGALVASESK